MGSHEKKLTFLKPLTSPSPSGSSDNYNLYVSKEKEAYTPSPYPFFHVLLLKCSPLPRVPFWVKMGKEFTVNFRDLGQNCRQINTAQVNREVR